MEIPEITDLDMAFGNIKHLPSMEEIPEEFKKFMSIHAPTWNRVFSEWFFKGINPKDLIPKEGVDKRKALRVIGACMKSFEPKHEHKEAGCAYLLSKWFEEYLPFKNKGVDKAWTK